MTGTIQVLCPEMPTIRISWTERRTSEIIATTFLYLPDNRVISGQLTFPVCSIRKKLFLLWLVDKVTARGDIGEVTLEPEWTFGPLAFPCKASGWVWADGAKGAVNMRFPFAWAEPTGPKQWTVEAVIGKGTVTF